MLKNTTVRSQYYSKHLKIIPIQIPNYSLKLQPYIFSLKTTTYNYYLKTTYSLCTTQFLYYGKELTC